MFLFRDWLSDNPSGPVQGKAVLFRPVSERQRRGQQEISPRPVFQSWLLHAKVRCSQKLKSLP